MNNSEQETKCNGNCGMNYCDEYGCIENKPEGDVSHLLTPPPQPLGIDVEDLAAHYLTKVGTHDRPDITKHDFIEGFKAGYAASQSDKITISYPDHYKMVLTNSNGDTYTSSSVELKDFLHNTKASFKIESSTSEEETDLWEEVANVLYGFEMGRRFDMNELLSTYKIYKR